MLDISPELKALYKQDDVYKYLTLYFPAINLTIENDKIVNNSMILDESLCSETDLTLGACEAAQIKITVADIIQELKGQVFTVTQTVGTYTMPLGTYKVDSVIRQSDRRLKQITAYDALRDTDVDVAAWYNALTFPISKKNMLHSLLTRLGILYVDQSLPNDDIMLEKTMNPSSLIARDVLQRLCELSAGFGHITRYNKFKVITLTGLGLYPSETLYPSEDLFPSETGEVLTSGYQSIDYEDYLVEPITALKIIQDDSDIGTTSGTGDNVYAIVGNYLVFGKDSTTMQTIANNIFLQIKNKFYKPHKTIMVGLPYLEVGDSVLIVTSNDAIESFVFKRTLSGIHSLSDNISATGNPRIEQVYDTAQEIQQLKGKTLSIDKSIDQLTVTISDTEQQLQSQITQTASEIRQEVTDTANGLQGQISLTAQGLQTQITNNQNETNSQISQLSDNISIKVSKGDVSSQISIEPGTVTFNSNRLVINSTNLQLDSSGNATFSGRVEGATINGAQSVSTSSLLVTGTGSSTSINGGFLETQYINGYTPVTYGNLPSTSNLTANLTSAENLMFANKNAAAVTWVDDNFERKTASDERLKDNFKPLDELPVSLFLELIPYQFTFKTDNYGKGIHFGFKAQQIEESFKKYGYDPYEYNIIELVEPKSYEGEDKYVKDKVHRINYKNIHAWNTLIIQKICKKINLI